MYLHAPTCMRLPRRRLSTIAELEQCTILDHQDEPETALENLKEDIVERQTCCRCCSEIAPGQPSFDMDDCAHLVCVSCRVIHVLPCKFCSPNLIKQETIPMKNDLASLKSRFLRKTVNKDHIVDVDATTSKELKQMCTVCQRVFKRSNARYHYSCASGKKPLACELCAHTFVKKSHLQVHLNSHYGIKPFKCTEAKCKASFYQKDKLVRHIKTHAKELSFVCTTCKKTFAMASTLKIHMRRVHSTGKPHQCDRCPRSYKHSRSLRIHQLKHQGTKEYMCEVCGKSYSLATQLRQHRLSHRPYNRRPHKCGCGKRFISKRDRARHQLIHVTTRDFECSICKTTFGRKDNLERHMKNFHPTGPVMEKRTAAASKSLLPSAAFTADLQLSTKPLEPTKTNLPQKNKGGKVKDACKKRAKKDTKTAGTVVKSTPEHAELVKTTSETVTANQSAPPTVIKSTKPNENQNRPSVIKQMPKLMHYRELPPDKRFLKMTEDISKSKSLLELMPPPSTSYNAILKLSSRNSLSMSSTSSSSTKGNPDKTDTSKDIGKKIVTKPQAKKRKYSKDDPLNRCFRIICHTSNVQTQHNKAPIRSNKRLLKEQKINNPQTLPSGKNLVPRRVKKLVTSTLPEVKLENKSLLISIQPVKKGPVVINDSPNSFTASKQRVADKVIGGSEVPLLELETYSDGPSLPVSLPENLTDNNDDQFETPYTPLGEPSCSSYIPYFESCFRDGANQYYDGNVDPLLTNDLDIGFQYINEEFTSTETSFTSESKILRYISQETRVVREFFP